MSINNSLIEELIELQRKAQNLTTMGQTWSSDAIKEVMETMQKWGGPLQNWTVSSNQLENLTKLWNTDNLPRGGGREPYVNIMETDSEMVITARLPGIRSSEDISIKVKSDVVHISGKSSKLNGTFSRVVRLPSEAEHNGSTATYENDYLSVRLPKKNRNYIDIRVNFV